MRSLKPLLFASTAVMIAGHAFAQTTPGPASSPASQSTPISTSGPDQGPGAPAAQGQTTEAGVQAATAGPGGNQVSEVVVTGSRIARRDLTQSQPVSVVGGEYIRSRGFTNLADAINELPAAGVAITPQGDQNDFGTGRNYINLFNLGTNRTLTLVNGRRFVGDNPTNIFSNEAGNQVDINALPTLFVDRVEEVPATGAAVYGSDAVAGVVNIILKDKYRGLEVNAQTGFANNGGAPRYTTEIAFGSDFLGGKANLGVDFQYDRTNALTYQDRQRTRDQYAFVANPADTGPSDGIPGKILIKNDRFANVTVGGLPFADGNGTPIFFADGTQAQFGKDGGLVPYNPGIPYTFYDASGGDALNLAPYTALQTPVDRKVITAIGSYEFSPHLRLKTNFFFSDNAATEPVNQPNYSALAFGTSPAANQPVQGAAFFIPTDNAYLTPATRAVLAANGVTDGFYLSRANVDLTPSPVASSVQTIDGSLDLEGDFKALDRTFTWNAAWVRGSSFSTFSNNGFVFGNPDVGIANRLGYALDAVLGPAGTPVCRVQLDNPGSTNPDIANCKPLNVFGEGNASPGAINYVTADFGYKARNQQDDGQINLSTSVIKLPAGDVKVSVGYEYRREQAEFTPNAAAQAGIGYSVPIGTQRGAYNTNEYYVEGLLPILGPGFSFPFAERFELEGAYRKVKNSLAGENEAWSYGGRFSPIKDLTFRGSRSKTFRAPAITELFASSTAAYDAGTDPCTTSNITSGPNPSVRAANCAAAFKAVGANLAGFTSSTVENVTIPVTIGGNPNLKNEVGQSWTYGFVVQPRFTPGLAMTVDYVHIDVTNAIEFFGIGNLLEACYDSPGYPSSSCGQFSRDANGQVINPSETYVNAGYTQFAAASYTLTYDRNINQIPFVHTDNDFGRIGLSFNALNTRRLITSASGLGFDAINSADTLGATSGEVNAPRWRWQASLRYSYKNLSATWVTHYVSATKYDLTFTKENQDILQVGDYYSHDVSAELKLDNHLTARVNVNNITDSQPPFPARGIGTYDIIGRYFLISLSGKF